MPEGAHRGGSQAAGDEGREGAPQQDFGAAAPLKRPQKAQLGPKHRSQKRPRRHASPAPERPRQSRRPPTGRPERGGTETTTPRPAGGREARCTPCRYGNGGPPPAAADCYDDGRPGTRSGVVMVSRLPPSRRRLSSAGRDSSAGWRKGPVRLRRAPAARGGPGRFVVSVALGRPPQHPRHPRQKESQAGRPIPSGARASSLLSVQRRLFGATRSEGRRDPGPAFWHRASLSAKTVLIPIRAQRRETVQPSL